MPKRKITNNDGLQTTQKFKDGGTGTPPKKKEEEKKRKKRGWSQALLYTKNILLEPVELLLLQTGYQSFQYHNNLLCYIKMVEHHVLHETITFIMWIISIVDNLLTILIYHTCSNRFYLRIVWRSAVINGNTYDTMVKRNDQQKSNCSHNVTQKTKLSNTNPLKCNVLR